MSGASQHDLLALRDGLLNDLVDGVRWPETTLPLRRVRRTCQRVASPTSDRPRSTSWAHVSACPFAHRQAEASITLDISRPPRQFVRLSVPCSITRYAVPSAQSSAHPPRPVQCVRRLPRLAAPLVHGHRSPQPRRQTHEHSRAQTRQRTPHLLHCPQHSEPERPQSPVGQPSPKRLVEQLRFSARRPGSPFRCRRCCATTVTGRTYGDEGDKIG